MGKSYYSWRAGTWQRTITGFPLVISREFSLPRENTELLTVLNACIRGISRT